MGTTTKKSVLVVEDSAVDCRFLVSAIKAAANDVNVQTAPDGVAAMAFFGGESAPDLVVTDLRMPNMDGFDLLQRLKSRPETSTVPVVVVSNSTDPDDIRQSYERHAAGYLAKPDTPVGYQRLGEDFARFWFNQVLLPN